MSKYSVEKHVRVYDDQSGFYWSVGPDTDVPGAVALGFRDGATFRTELPAMPPEAARLLAKAILELYPETEQ